MPYQPDIHREQRERLHWVQPVPGDDVNRKRFDYNSLNTKVGYHVSREYATTTESTMRLKRLANLSLLSALTGGRCLTRFDFDIGGLTSDTLTL